MQREKKYRSQRQWRHDQGCNDSLLKQIGYPCIGRIASSRICAPVQPKRLSRLA